MNSREPKGSHNRSAVPADGAVPPEGMTKRGPMTWAGRSHFALNLATAALVVGTYLALLARTMPIDWHAFSIVAVGLAALPFVIGFVLSALREHDMPITAATLTTAAAVAVVVALLSAMRVHMSYTGILFCIPILLVAMTLLMMRLQRRLSERLAILDFPGASAARARLGGECATIRLTEEPSWNFDRVLIDVRTHHAPEWSGVLVKCYARRIEVTPFATFLERRHGQVDLAGFDVTDVAWRPSQILYARTKRLLDIAGVLVGLPVLLPLALVTWMYVRIKAGKDSVFVQQRRGFAGETFSIYKFRTMWTDAETPAGGHGGIIPGLAAIRRLRLDELPQMFNILRGDMSWIGPRPASLAVAAAAEQSEPRYVSRLLVRPGLSGWAQVNSGYANTTAEEIEKLTFDLYYIKHLSLDLDVIILFRTAWVILAGHRRKASAGVSA